MNPRHSFWKGHRNHRESRPPPHRRDVGEGTGHRLVADGFRFRPGKMEVNPVNDRIGFQKDRPGSNTDNRGVVAGVHQDIRRLISQTGANPAKKIQFRHGEIISDRTCGSPERLNVMKGFLGNLWGILLKGVQFDGHPPLVSDFLEPVEDLPEPH